MPCGDAVMVRLDREKGTNGGSCLDLKDYSNPFSLPVVSIIGGKGRCKN